MKVAVLTGAGISRESGLLTFRDEGGLWCGHKVEDVATPEAFERSPSLVLEFYNQRRKQVREAVPNPAHEALARLGETHDVRIITQNIDDLHERAGSNQVIHLHGQILFGRSSVREDLIFPWEGDMAVGDLAPDGTQVRPHVVWFGEPVPAMTDAQDAVSDADVLMIVGTSLQVYPAAGLAFSSRAKQIILIDPNPAMQSNGRTVVLSEMASVGVPAVVESLLKGHKID